MVVAEWFVTAKPCKQSECPAVEVVDKLWYNVYSSSTDLELNVSKWLKLKAEGKMQAAEMPS